MFGLSRLLRLASNTQYCAIALIRVIVVAELFMGLFSLTQASPTQKLTDPTQRKPITKEKFEPMTQPNPQCSTTNNQVSGTFTITFSTE